MLFDTTNKKYIHTLYAAFCALGVLFSMGNFSIAHAQVNVQPITTQTDSTGTAPNAVDPGSTDKQQPATSQQSAVSNAVDASQPIYTVLQIPIPFVERNCQAPDAEGNLTVPAVCSLTDYIKGVYRLLIGLGALFGVVMIIIGGYQWLFSGGSSDRVGAAKKRIFGAAIGLILALLSFVILNTITPRLVSVRLPNIEPVRTISLAPDATNCSSPVYLDRLFTERNGGRFEEPKNGYDQTRIKDLIDNGDATFEAINTRTSTPGSTATSTPLSQAICANWQSVVEKGKKDVVSQCKGNYCSNSTKESCAPSGCKATYMFGAINWPLLTERFVDQIDIYGVCDGSLMSDIVGSVSTSRSRQYYVPRELVTVYGRGATIATQVQIDSQQTPKFGQSSPYEAITTYERARRLCEGQAGKKLNGFILSVEVYDGILGDDNLYAVGKGCVKALGLARTGTALYDFSILRNNVKPFVNNLFQVSDFDLGAVCDLNINNIDFPDFD